MSGGKLRYSQYRRRRQFKRFRKSYVPKQIYDGDALTKVQITAPIRNDYNVAGQEVACPLLDTNAITSTG